MAWYFTKISKVLFLFFLFLFLLNFWIIFLFNNRDFLTRSISETLISVVYNHPPTISQSESSCDSSNEIEQCENTNIVPTLSLPESEIIIYLSLITPIDEPDEYDWIKWPILGFGVAAFLLYKIFNPGTKFAKKTTSSSSYRSSTFNGLNSSKQNSFRSSVNVEEERTAELRRELERVNGM